jgi:hypothetical protein
LLEIRKMSGKYFFDERLSDLPGGHPCPMHGNIRNCMRWGFRLGRKLRRHSARPNANYSYRATPRFW